MFILSKIKKYLSSRLSKLKSSLSQPLQSDKMISSENALYVEFIQAISTRMKMKLPPTIEQQLEYEQYTIKKQHDSAPKDKKKKKLHLTDQYVDAFSKLTKAERIELYRMRVRVLTDIFAQKPPKVPNTSIKTIDVYIRGATLRSWKQKTIQVNGEDVNLILEKEGKKTIHNLSHYILRKSKNTDYFCFVLEVVDSVPKTKYDTIHIGFTNTNQFNIVYQEVKDAIEYGVFLNYQRELGFPTKILAMQRHKTQQSEPSSPQKMSPSDKKMKQQIRKNVQEGKTNDVTNQQSGIINRIMMQKIQLKYFDEIDHQHNSEKAIIIEQLLPNYDFNNLFSQQNMTILQSSPNHKILHDNTNKKRFKVLITIPNNLKKVFCDLTNPQDLKKINTQIQQINIKNMIRSQNTAVIYMKLRNYNAVYRGRDFLFLRHVFKMGKNLYIVDKSIENIDYPPFITIVRGQILAVWCLVQDEKTSKTFLILDATVNNQGILNEQQNTNLTVRYISNFCRLEKYSYINEGEGQLKVQSYLFDLNWNIKIKESNLASRIQTLQLNINNKQSKILNQSKYQGQKKNSKDIESKTQAEQKGQVQLMTKSDCTLYTPQLDRQGRSITSWTCLKTQYKMQPWNQALKYDERNYEHHIWKGEWKRDEKDGGLWYKDEIRMNAQKKVLGYIVKKMGSNLIQGKNILNVSLPVDIFSTESNLERVARTFVYAPLVLEPASKMEDPVAQLKQVIILSLTHSLLYMSMQKPFNPVLGETFQGSINGCPISLEQISHHPPIAAFYLVGRGYRIYGCIESKMHIGVNTGTGLNEGDYIVHFDNGTIIKFRTPGGEISGLTFGDRKLNLVDKAFYWEPNHNLMLDVTYNPNKKGLFSFGKQKTPMDYFQGTIKKVKKQFIDKFQSEKVKSCPSDKDIISEYSKVDGIWTKQVVIDGKVIFDIDTQKYLKFQYEPNPLPSDANYREDIIYRRLDNIPRSQNQKERIEVRQREDRKLREQFRKSHD